MKRLGLLLAATFTLAMLAPAVASAGVGTIAMNGSAPCNVTFNYTGSIPGNGSLDNFESDECDFNFPSPYLPLKIEAGNVLPATFTGTSTSGTATISGTPIEITIASGMIWCNYNLTTSPTGSYFSGNFFSVTGGAASRISGSFLCPVTLPTISISGILP